MPTVHLSLPEAVYRRLKEQAARMGIQVTDLIKIYIQNGLEQGFPGPFGGGQVKTLKRDVEYLDRKVSELEARISRDMMHLNGKLKEMEEAYMYLYERLEQIEEMISDIARELRGQRVRAASKEPGF